MKQYKKRISTTVLLAIAINLISPFALADSSAETNSHISGNSSASLNYQCDVQDAPSIFVLEALFANPENPYPVELWHNRDNEQINIFDIAREIKSIASLKEKIFNNTDEVKRIRLFERLAQMEDIADRALIMEADKWKPHYVNELMKHIIGIRNAGISDLLPNSVDATNCKEEPLTDLELYLDNIYGDYLSKKKREKIFDPCDENGQHWTSLTNLAKPNKKGPSIANYMQEHGTDIQIINIWWESQIGQSWCHGCRAVKAFYANQRTLDTKNYFWGSGGGEEEAQDEYSCLWKQGRSDDFYLCYPGTTDQEERYIKAFTIWHAYVQEVLSKVKFPHNNQTNKQVCLIRTTGLNSIARNNINQFGKDYIIPSASYDSFSLISIYGTGGCGPISAIIESLVPHHRIIHLYPLLNGMMLMETKKELEKELIKDVNFIIKNYYDENGSLTIDQKNPSAAEKFIEEFIYHQIATIQHKASIITWFYGNTYLSDFSINGQFPYKELFSQRVLSSLPEKLETDNPSEILLDILISQHELNVNANKHIIETEFVVLSGPDLPFDYFHNTVDCNVDEDLIHLQHLQEKLENGEGVCKGYKLTGARDENPGHQPTGG